MRTNLRSPIPWLALVLGIIVAVAIWPTGDSDSIAEEISFSEFDAVLDAGSVEEIEMIEGANLVRATLADGTEVEAQYVGRDSDALANRILEEHPEIELNVSVDRGGRNLFVSVLLSLLPMMLFLGVIIWFWTKMSGQGGNNKFSKANAKRNDPDIPSVSFADVAGADEAVEELREIKEFLDDPTRFYAMGAKIPKGVLLYGPPGTGKTLLARAVAGEAGVPFFSISGSDFVEMFVGVGASRVRDLFQQAKDEAPAIIFIDEIDAVGRHRGAGLGGGHDEREQTLNQMLVEMDGFDPTSGVIMIAATNRPDILDPALLRPGRFDRQITVDRPDLEGRTQILAVHAAGKPLAEDVDQATIARRTPGFTGADLANLMNESALLAARHRLPTISMAQVDEAIDRVMAGPQRKNRVLGDHERRVIAYHEAGHALVGHLLEHTDPIHKVSIISRGRALGWTLSLPEQDRYLKTRSQLHDDLAMLLGGRTAEEMIFGDPTTGAADDIDRATTLAQAMVTEYGMSDLGPRKFGQAKGEVFLGKDMGHEETYSQSVAKSVDSEVARFVNEAHAEARMILETHIAVLDRLADALLEHETLNKEELAEIFAGVSPWVRATSVNQPHPVIDLRDTNEDDVPMPKWAATERAGAGAGSHASGLDQVDQPQTPKIRRPGDGAGPGLNGAITPPAAQ